MPPVYAELGQALRTLFPPALGLLDAGKSNSSVNGLRLTKDKCCAYQAVLCWGWLVSWLVGVSCFCKV